MKILMFIPILMLITCSDNPKASSLTTMGTKRNEILKRPIEPIEVISLRQPRHLENLKQFGYSYENKDKMDERRHNW